MDKAVLCAREDAFIDRGSIAEGQPIALRDLEGVVLMKFPLTWSDRQILIALDFANDAFAKGEACGRIRLAAELREKLGVQG